MTSSPPRVPPDEKTLPANTHLRDIWTPRALGGLLAALLGSYALDVVYLGHAEPRVLGLRVFWSLCVFGLYFVHGSRGRERVATYLGIIVSSTCFVVLAFLMGGVGSPYFTLMLVLPLLVGIALMSRGERGAILTCGAVCGLGTCLLLATTHRPPSEWVAWLLAVVSTTVVGDFLCHGVDRRLRAEQQARLERARRESLEALAFSEHRRAHTEKLATVGRMASNVAHEINNPLAYVGSNLDFVHEALLGPQEVDREELAQALAEARGGLQHIRQIVADLRGFARMDAQEPGACALVDVVADAMKLGSLRLKHVAWLQVDVPMDLPEIFVVRPRMVQVVLNLLVNAGDALEAQGERQGEIRVTGRAEPGRVVLLIEDNGPGFAPQVLPRLFEAFFTTKSVDKGTGLGLNLSRELVEQMGGTLTASNRAEGGARLRIELPLRPANTPERTPEVPEARH